MERPKSLFESRDIAHLLNRSPLLAKSGIAPYKQQPNAMRQLNWRRTKEINWRVGSAQFRHRLPKLQVQGRSFPWATTSTPRNKELHDLSAALLQFPEMATEPAAVATFRFLGGLADARRAHVLELSKVTVSRSSGFATASLESVLCGANNFSDFSLDAGSSVRYSFGRTRSEEEDAECLTIEASGRCRQRCPWELSGGCSGGRRPLGSTRRISDGVRTDKIQAP